MRSNRSSALSLPLHCRSGNFGAPPRAIKPGRALLRTRKINGFCASKSRSMRQHASTPGYKARSCAFAQAKATAPSLEDLINGLQRKRLGYKTPEELFDEKLDLIYRL